MVMKKMFLLEQDIRKMQRGNGKMVRSTLTGMPEDHYGRMEKSRLQGYFEKKKRITLFYILYLLNIV